MRLLGLSVVGVQHFEQLGLPRAEFETGRPGKQLELRALDCGPDESRPEPPGPSTSLGTNGSVGAQEQVQTPSSGWVADSSSSEDAKP